MKIMLMTELDDVNIIRTPVIRIAKHSNGNCTVATLQFDHNERPIFGQQMQCSARDLENAPLTPPNPPISYVDPLERMKLETVHIATCIFPSPFRTRTGYINSRDKTTLPVASE